MVGLTLTRAVYIRIAYMQPTIAGSRVADHRCFLGMVQKQVTAQGWLMSTPEGDAPGSDADALGARWLSPAGPPAIPLSLLTKIRVLNPA